MFVMMLIFSHIRIHGCPYGMVVKSQELPEFIQTVMKPLSKHHHKISSASHKNELASTVDVNKQRKIN
jgi:predicted transcriptional regulator